jgi:hypothetical protein
MPQVGKMKFPYTPEGKKAAKKAAMAVKPGAVKKSKMTQGQAMAKGIERAMDKFRK